MAEDKGDGGGGSPWPIVGVLGAVGAAQAAVGEVVTELESFTKFQQRVDELIRDLKGSPADSKKLRQEPLDRAQFGGGSDRFKEANGLYTSYQTVITELEALSQLLSDSIEAMGIAVLKSHKGYANIDDDIKDRMRAISAAATKEYGGPYVPDLPKKENDTKDPVNHGSPDSGKPVDGASGGGL
ncbi:hypothetical protein ACFVTY_34395 [Streptomyces sp. NPDC058067]|uniref:hypothetical protein n=1 Tax=Streptomyces sp. NPDC058067 TaxID=3346324 RepID=UPI0036DFE7BD